MDKNFKFKTRHVLTIIFSCNTFSSSVELMQAMTMTYKLKRDAIQNVEKN